MTEMIRSCQECGSEFTTTRGNAKLCPYHRFRRDIVFAREKTKGKIQTCPACERQFLPTHYPQQFCAACINAPSIPVKECSICGEHRKLINVDFRVCGRCTEMTTDTGQKRLWDKIRLKDRQITENPHRVTVNA